VSDLPEGVMVADDEGTPYLVMGQRLLRWEPGGYRQGIPKPAGAILRILTPKSTVLAIALGYPVIVHPSAGETLAP
jgi:hypothetical protein